MLLLRWVYGVYLLQGSGVQVWTHRGPVAVKSLSSWPSYTLSLSAISLFSIIFPPFHIHKHTEINSEELLLYNPSVTHLASEFKSTSAGFFFFKWINGSEKEKKKKREATLTSRTCSVIDTLHCYSRCTVLLPHV